MQGFVKGLLAGQWVVGPVDVLVWVGVVVVILEDEVPALDPAYVEVRITSNLKDSSLAHVSSLVQFFYFEDNVPKTGNPAV